MKDQQPMEEFIEVNKILGKEASFGLIPAEQVLPLSGCLLVAMSLGTFFELPFQIGAALFLWLSVSWLLLTGRHSHQFIERFFALPGKGYINGSTVFVPATAGETLKRKQREVNQPIQLKLPSGKIENFHQFQRENNLHGILDCQFGEYHFAALLLCEGGDKWSAVLPFSFEGLHTQLYAEEIEQYRQSLEEMLKNLPQGENLTFMLGCRSDYEKREASLNRKIKKTKLGAIGLMLQSEKIRGQKLTKKGRRQVWEQIVFATWTQEKQSQQKDWLGGLVKKILHLWEQFLVSLTGTRQQYQENIYAKLGRQIYTEGFLHWQMLLETQGNLKIQPWQSEELWQWLWNRFNQGEAPSPPQIIRVFETREGIQVRLEQNETLDPISALIRGENGKSSCPQVQNRSWVEVNERFCGVLTLEAGEEARPAGWKASRQLTWIWEQMSQPYIRDTEIWVQLEPANKFWLKFNLQKITKQASHANAEAAKVGTVLDVAATQQQREALKAQELIQENHSPVYAAMTILVYRRSPQELERACGLLAKGFGTARLIREDKVAWKLWLETLPTNTKKQLVSTAVFSQRRHCFDTRSLAGILPLAKPKPIDTRGVELITRHGGYPIHIDLFTHNLRALITAKSGAGKGIFAFAFMRDALAQNIPVIGMDMSLEGTSTFKVITSLLGDDGAYIDLTKVRNNILQLPDLRGLSHEERQKRRNIWKSSVRHILTTLAMGSIADDPALYQRVDALLLKALEIFLKDDFIKSRYNRAFESGWKSEAWQQIPTAWDLLSYCSREKLQLQDYEEIDRRALNQIKNELKIRLLDPNIGDALAKPSSYSPAAMCKCFGFSGLSNQQNSYVMALVANLATTTTALAYPKTLICYDEASILLSKPGFASVVGETFAAGRKSGMSLLIISQELESICQSPEAAKILRNLNFTLTGQLKSYQIYQEVFQMPRKFISRNTTDAYAPNYAEKTTYWLVESNSRYWECGYSAPNLDLAALVNSDRETQARNRCFALYPHTKEGKIDGLVCFSQQYALYLRGKLELEEIGSKRLELKRA